MILEYWSNHFRPKRPRSFGQHQESRPWLGPLAGSNTVSPRFTDFPSLCACSESSLTNLIGSGLILLCLQCQSEPESHWTYPEVVILGADQKERGLWGTRMWSNTQCCEGILEGVGLCTICWLGRYSLIISLSIVLNRSCIYEVMGIFPTVIAKTICRRP